MFEIHQKIEAVTLDQVKQVMEKYLKNKKPAIVKALSTKVDRS